MSDQNHSTNEVASPCVDICVLGVDAICVGCFRNSDEIACWMSATTEERQEILQQCSQRREKGANNS